MEIKNIFLKTILSIFISTSFITNTYASPVVPEGKLASEESSSYDLNEIFSDSSGTRTFYLTFKNSPAANFSIKYNHNIVASVADGFITLSQVNSVLNPEKINVLYYARASDASSYIHLGYQIGDDDSIIIQEVQTDSDYNYVTSSPKFNLINIARDELPEASEQIEINNLSTDSTLTIVRSSFITLADDESSKEKRSTKLECVLPVLAIANYILNTPCNLTEMAYNYIAGDQDEVINKQEPSSIQFSPSFELNALYYSDKINPYSAYSAATTCKISLDKIYSKRKPRDPEDTDCIYQTVDILTPYLILSNYDFDQAHFNNVIANIINQGQSGIPDALPELEQQLVVAVQSRANQADENAQAAMQNLLTQASRLNSSTIALNELLSSTESNAANQPSTSSQPSINPQQYALGHYELDLQQISLDDFRSQYPDASARIWNGEQFVAADSDFSVEIIQNASDAQTTRIIDILDQWYPDESSSSESSDSSGSSPTLVDNAKIDADVLLHQGRNLSDGMRYELRQGDPNHVYFLISYNNQPAAIIQSHINTDVAEAVLISSISNPVNIALPYTTESLRGAGQRGLQEMIKFCINNGIKLINADAVTRPSAYLKVKYGFKFEDDL